MKTRPGICAWCGKPCEVSTRNNHKVVFCSTEHQKAHKYASDCRRRAEAKAREVDREYYNRPTSAEQRRREAHQKDTAIWNNNYAERQKQKTLAMLGKIEV